MNAHELYKAGKLKDAIDAQLQEVKAKPADQTKRIFLFELLAFSGDIERAKKHIELIEYPEMELMAAVTSYRKLLDSEEMRRKTFKNGEPPRFFDAQPDHVHLRIEAINKLRSGEKAEAGKLIAKANELTPTFTGKLNDKPFTAFRDWDDVLAGVLEVFAQGQYYWVPFDQVELVTVAAVKTPARPSVAVRPPGNARFGGEHLPPRALPDVARACRRRGQARRHDRREGRRRGAGAGHRRPHVPRRRRRGEHSRLEGSRLRPAASAAGAGGAAGRFLIHRFARTDKSEIAGRAAGGGSREAINQDAGRGVDPDCDLRRATV